MRKFTILLAFLLLAGMQAIYAQEVKGTVTDAADGTKIPGVSVIVQGTTVGTVTDVDGKYVIQVPTGSNILIFSFVGMKTKEVKIDGRAVIDIALNQDVLGLDEVVVTAVGISRESKALGYSVQEVKGSDLTRTTNANVINSLGGRVAGVQVNSSSGAAGGSTYITIRGAHSILGNNQPLFVIDGVPIDDSRATDNDGFYDDVAGVDRTTRSIDLNPDDIESMTVLKGGAATALYGIRASNGAIIITTKKGKATPGKKIAVTLSQSFGWDQISQKPSMQKIYGQGTDGEWVSGASTTWGPRLDTCGYTQNPEVWNTWSAYDVDGNIVSLNDPMYQPELGPIKTYDQYDFFENGFTSSTSLGFSGGSDVGTFYASIGYLSQDAIIPNNNFKKWTFKLSGDAKISKKMSISGGVNYIESGGDLIQQGSNVSGVMLGLLRTPPTFNNAAGYIFEDGTQRNYRHGGGYDNPYWTANENIYNDKVKRTIGNVTWNYLPLDWIRVTWRLGVDMYSRQAHNYFAINSRQYPDGLDYEYNSQNRDYNSDLLANFRHDLATDLVGNLTLGWNFAELYQNYIYSNANGLVLPNFYNISNTASISSTQITNEIRRAGLFFDAGLEWKSMVFLNITGRNDWSTTLPSGSNSFFYPSVNLGFVFTELDALKDNNVISYGKIRGSWAKIANDAEPYKTVTYFDQANPGDGWVNAGLVFPLLGYAGYTLSDNLGNPNLEPENNRTWEVGADLKFFKMNRLGVDITYFDTKNTELLLDVPIAATSGYNTIYMNAATMTSKGWEIVAYGTPVKVDNFVWDINLNFTKINNEVTELAPGVPNVFLGGFEDPQIRAVVGDPYRSIYGYDWVRDDNGNVIIDDDPESSSYGYPAGDYDNLVPLGAVDPDWTMGIGSNMQILHNINLYFLFDIKQGGQMWNGTRGAMYYFGTHGDQINREPDDYYVFDGVKASDGAPNDIQVIRGQDWYYYNEGSGFTGPTVQFIEKTGWVRLREVTLSYDFGSKVIGSNGFFKNLQVYFTGRNLWLSTDYTGIDPETNLLGSSNAQGMDYFNMPGTKTYIIGLKAGF